MDLARSLPSDKRRYNQQAKDADRLEPKGHCSGYRVSDIPCHGQPTLPADREHLTHSCQPCGTWEARTVPSFEVGKPSGRPLTVWVKGCGKANARLSSN